MNSFLQYFLRMTVLNSNENITSIVSDVAGIAKLLSELDPTKSSGPDRIPNKLLKTLATEVSPCFF